MAWYDTTVKNDSKMKDRVLVDLSHIYNFNLRKSIPIYCFRFLDAVPIEYADRFVLLINRELETYFRENYPLFELKLWRRNPFLLRNDRLKNLYVKYSYLFHVCFGNYDSVLILSDLVPYTRFRVWRKKKIVLIHDQKSCEYHDSKARNEYCRKFYSDLLQSANKIIAISGFTKKEITRIHGINPDRIDVIHNSVILPQESALASSLPENYILHVNTLQAYKNAETLVRAFCKLKKQIDHSLVLVGNETDYWTNTLLPIIKEHRVENRVILLSDISNEQLKYCYEHARLFVSTSTREGFGYTPIEAAICGCPVICSTCESLPEVTAGRVAYYEPYNDYHALACAILHEITHPTDQGELKQTADFFSQKYSSANMFEAYRQILFA